MKRLLIILAIASSSALVLPACGRRGSILPPVPWPNQVNLQLKNNAIRVFPERILVKRAANQEQATLECGTNSSKQYPLAFGNWQKCPLVEVDSFVQIPVQQQLALRWAAANQAGVARTIDVEAAHLFAKSISDSTIRHAYFEELRSISPVEKESARYKRSLIVYKGIRYFGAPVSSTGK